MSVNHHHYRREGFEQPHRGSAAEERHFDVFNNPKQLFSGRNEDHYFLGMKEEGSQSPKGNQESLRKTFTHFLAYQPEVTGKVGAINYRDYSIPRPQLKVGNQSYVDTYSPF
jgi:hypothetical protein